MAVMGWRLRVGDLELRHCGPPSWTLEDVGWINPTQFGLAAGDSRVGALCFALAEGETLDPIATYEATLEVLVAGKREPVQTTVFVGAAERVPMQSFPRPGHDALNASAAPKQLPAVVEAPAADDKVEELVRS